MELKEQLTSVPGMLRPFKAFLMEAGLLDGDQIVYYGCPGTCTPFIELLGFAIRDLPFEQVFVPYVDESKAKKIRLVRDVGMQVSDESAVPNPTVAVLMGGLSMPNVPVTKEQVKEVIDSHHASSLVGVSFMKMFEKTGWLKTFDFNLLIDATIDPVDVWR
ncbi:hypothetical protein ASZ90_010678 [hydrocarbon metagenome]|uniref:DUF2124 domain-containing protein n=1 Tax=hydrocarbon metagenome TaxID=938273 RepID=A0A0W8FFF8_9ZZZZ|nr:DUF2124 domain-containing protein [Methanomicrobiaceae archaeon]